MRQERQAMLAAIAANTNWDSAQNAEARRQRIENIDLSYKQAVEILMNRADKAMLGAPDPMQDDDLFRPLRNQAAEINEQVSSPIPPEAGLGKRLLG